jgi:hypothetical protein
MSKGKVFVQRQLVTKEDKEFYSYFIDVVVRGKANRVLISAPDVGGYKVLDIVFGNEDKAELTVQKMTMTDAKGKESSYVKYGVKSVDEDGKIYECKIKPFRGSDKDLLEMYLN